MSSSKIIEPIDVVPSGYFAPGKGSARELARAIPNARQAKPATARSRISAGKSGKKVRVQPLGPTPERLAKGDIDVRIGMHRSVPPVERLRDQGKLATPLPMEEVEKLKRRGELSYDVRENQACYEAALKLRRHFEGCMKSVQAQDLNKIIGGHGGDDLTKEESWVHNRDQFVIAVKLMGWFENRYRGAGRMVVAVVCEEITVLDAAEIHIGRGDTTALMGAAMDRLREGLFALAVHWRFL